MVDYKYQLELTMFIGTGFPVIKYQDVANRMRFHHLKLQKTCPFCQKNICLNKPNRKCIDCQIDLYANNSQITDFIPKDLRSVTIL